MITSKDCWLKDSCKKCAVEPQFCSGDIFCLKLFKVDALYNKKVELLINGDEIYLKTLEH